MKSVIGHITGVTSKLTPYRICVYSTDHMAQHPILNISGSILHGGWYFEVESHLFYYITKLLHASQAELILGNHDDPKNCLVYSIDCIINDNIRKNIHHYIDNLFGNKIGGAPAIFTIKTYLFA